MEAGPERMITIPASLLWQISLSSSLARTIALMVLLLPGVEHDGWLGTSREFARVLSRMLSVAVNRKRVREALDELEEAGIISVSRNGRGIRIALQSAEYSAYPALGYSVYPTKYAQSEYDSRAHRAAKKVSSTFLSQEKERKKEELRKERVKRVEWGGCGGGGKGDEGEGTIRSVTIRTHQRSFPGIPGKELWAEEALSKAVRRLFEHWKATPRNRSGAKLTTKRERKLRDRLKQYSEVEVRQAIDGYAVSPFHQGQNERGKRYDDLELICRDGEHIEAGWELLEIHNGEREPDLIAEARRQEQTRQSRPCANYDECGEGFDPEDIPE